MGGISFETEEDLFQELLSCDWDEARGTAIQGVGIFDEMLDESKSRPVTMPTVKGLRSAFERELEKFHEEMSHNSVGIVILMAQQDGQREEGDDEFILSRDTLEIDDDVVGFLINALACCAYPLSICVTGVPYSLKHVEMLTKSALESLGPISRAKAEGRF